MFEWEMLDVRREKGTSGELLPPPCLWRARVPGGWLRSTGIYSNARYYTHSLAFCPDPDHVWDGSTLPPK